MADSKMTNVITRKEIVNVRTILLLIETVKNAKCSLGTATTAVLGVLAIEFSREPMFLHDID